MVSVKGEPAGWFSYDFEIFDRTGASVGRADLSNWRENATLEVGGESFSATHESFQKDFVLSDKDGEVIFVVEKPSAWTDRFTFEYEGKTYELKKASTWGRDFVILREGIGEVGSVRPEGMFKRGWQAEVPDEFSNEIRLFILWLVVLIWSRDDSTAASTST